MPWKKGDPNHPRRGKGSGGPGWGGPARGGVGNSVTRTPGPGRGHTNKSVAELLAAQGARELAAERWLHILQDPAHPHHATMIVKAAERMDGAPTQRLEVRDVDPEQMTDEELVAIASRGRRAASGTEDAPE